jgi:hypothetical protein
MMNPLRLSPLPTLRPEDESNSLLMEREGFVDEAVVTALMAESPYSRSIGYPEDLALAADDMDFAGRTLSAGPFRGSPFPWEAPEVENRRAEPPLIDEPGLGAPHRGSHRWWLAGLAGMLSTMLFSLLFITLSARPGFPADSVMAPKMLAVSKPSPAPKATPEKAVPALTEASASRP